MSHLSVIVDRASYTHSPITHGFQRKQNSRRILLQMLITQLYLFQLYLFSCTVNFSVKLVECVLQFICDSRQACVGCPLYYHKVCDEQLWLETKYCYMQERKRQLLYQPFVFYCIYLCNTDGTKDWNALRRNSEGRCQADEGEQGISAKISRL